MVSLYSTWSPDCLRLWTHSLPHAVCQWCVGGCQYPYMKTRGSLPKTWRMPQMALSLRQNVNSSCCPPPPNTIANDKLHNAKLNQVTADTSDYRKWTVEVWSLVLGSLLANVLSVKEPVNPNLGKGRGLDDWVVLRWDEQESTTKASLRNLSIEQTYPSLSLMKLKQEFKIVTNIRGCWINNWDVCHRMFYEKVSADI